MPLTTASSMLSNVVLGLARLLPRAPERDASPDPWSDSEAGWHNSSHALATGLDVIEHFGGSAHAGFPDTLPACHWPVSPVPVTPTR